MKRRKFLGILAGLASCIGGVGIAFTKTPQKSTGVRQPPSPVKLFIWGAIAGISQEHRARADLICVSEGMLSKECLLRDADARIKKIRYDALLADKKSINFSEFMQLVREMNPSHKYIATIRKMDAVYVQTSEHPFEPNDLFA